MPKTTTANGCYFDAADQVDGSGYIDYVRWVGATTAGHECILYNESDQIIYHGVASGANFQEMAPIEQYFTSIKVNTIGSGRLYIIRDKFRKQAY